MVSRSQDQESRNPPRTRRDRPRDPLLLRRVSDEPEFREILELHARWLETNKQDGKQADLQGADLHRADLSGRPLVRARLQRAILREACLREADLTEADLQGADLTNADLSEADLTRADLQGADLTEANLEGAELQATKLWDANLQDATLTNTTGLRGGCLAGAIVSGACLPQEILKFEGLEHVAEVSRNAGKLFTSMLLACAYAGLTLAATTDAALLAGSSSSRLPIVDTLTPIVGFYLLAPALLLGVYVYLLLTLQQLWEGLADLPAIFPDGRPLHKRAYPWLLNTIVRAYFPQLGRERTLLSYAQPGVCVIAAWCVVPLTLFFFWGRSLRRHDWFLTSTHVGLLALSAALAIAFGLLALGTLQGQLREQSRETKAEARSAIWQGRGGALRFLLLAGVFALLSWSAVEGVRRDSAIPAGHPRKWVPAVLAAFSLSPFADLHKAEVSAKPDTWAGDTQTEVMQVKGATLEGRDLRSADASRAFLVHANLVNAWLTRARLAEASLQGADLQGADLQGADLQGADLRWAHLPQANLRGADLQGADLRGAALQPSKPEEKGTSLETAILLQANLQGADFQRASLRQADLRFADLRAAQFQKADLGQARLKGADLRRASLQGIKLVQADCRAANFGAALLDGAELRGALLPGAQLWGAQLSLADMQSSQLQGANLNLAQLRSAQLRGADLTAAALRAANLQEAKLQGAHLLGTDLGGADLRGADLRGAVDLTQPQLDSAITDASTAVSLPLRVGHRRV